MSIRPTPTQELVSSASGAHVRAIIEQARDADARFWMQRPETEPTEFWEGAKKWAKKALGGKKKKTDETTVEKKKKTTKKKASRPKASRPNGDSSSSSNDGAGYVCKGDPEVKDQALCPTDDQPIG